MLPVLLGLATLHCNPLCSCSCLSSPNNVMWEVISTSSCTCRLQCRVPKPSKTCSIRHSRGPAGIPMLRMMSEPSIIMKAVCICSGTVLSCGKDNLLKTVNPQTFEVMQTFRAPQFSVGTIWCTPCISPDGQHVAAGSGNGSLFVWNVSHHLHLAWHHFTHPVLCASL